MKMSSTQQVAQQVPAGMTVVSQDEFYAALKADKRDIMPTTEAREYTPWRVVATRAMWGWNSRGYGSKHGTPDVYALAKASA
jgi:hypothetical protein